MCEPLLGHHMPFRTNGFAGDFCSSGEQARARARCVRTQARRGDHKWPAPAAAGAVACGGVLSASRPGRATCEGRSGWPSAKHPHAGPLASAASHGRPEALRATARGRGRKGCEYATHGAAIHVSIHRARCLRHPPRCGPARELVPGGGLLQPSATSSDLPSAASRGQAGACSPDRARSVHAAKAGLRAARTGSASAQAAQ